jgi:hypothetical protein
MTDHNEKNNTVITDNANKINDIMDEIDDMNSTKKIHLEIINKKTKKVNCEKERKRRVETNTWGLSKEELEHAHQLNVVNQMTSNINVLLEDTYMRQLYSHIKGKLCNYKQQDVLKHKYSKEEFVSFEETLQLLKKGALTCCYCSENVYVLYENVRDGKQWSLDRINNNIGHNCGNVVIACLGCNLKRRRTNKDAFMFTKKMIIVKTK